MLISVFSPLFPFFLFFFSISNLHPFLFSLVSFSSLLVLLPVPDDFLGKAPHACAHICFSFHIPLFVYVMWLLIYNFF